MRHTHTTRSTHTHSVFLALVLGLGLVAMGSTGCLEEEPVTTGETEQALEGDECFDDCMGEGSANHHNVPCVRPYPGAPCNKNVPGYNCPAQMPSMTSYYPRRYNNGAFCNSSSTDSGSFEHQGYCFRSVDQHSGLGQQCCYDPQTGLDNGTGSVDLAGCANGSWSNGSCTYSLGCVDDHCRVDVQPFCCALAGSDTASASEASYNSCIGTACRALPGVSWALCPQFDEEDEDEPDPDNNENPNNDHSGGSGGADREPMGGEGSGGGEWVECGCFSASGTLLYSEGFMPAEMCVGECDL